MAPLRRTHCPAGHPYNEANSYHHPTKRGRVCRECHRKQAREWWRKEHAKKVKKPKRKQKRDREGRWLKGPDRTPIPPPRPLM